MEIGSFIELQLPQEGEWFGSVSDRSIARLNSGRAAIYYALLLTQCEEIWVPYYQCESVKTFLLKKHIKITSEGLRVCSRIKKAMTERVKCSLIKAGFGLV